VIRNTSVMGRSYFTVAAQTDPGDSSVFRDERRVILGGLTLICLGDNVHMLKCRQS
jgi:hypothetical protein